MSISITSTSRFRTLDETHPLSSLDIEIMYNEGWMLISSLSYQEGDNWRFIYYFKNIKLGTREWK